MTAELSREMQYLLGKLPEQDAEALAAELFANDETFTALEVAESALVAAYLDDQLARDDRRRCEALLQGSRHLQECVELERDLRALSRRRPRRSVARWLPWAAAVVFGLSAGGLALQASREASRVRTAADARERELLERVAGQDERLRLLEQRLAEHATPAVETWPLTSAGERAGAGAGAFTATGGWVRLRLAHDAPEGASYHARLSVPEGREVLAVTGLAPVTESGRAFVDVMVPGRQLPRGTYVVSLTRTGAGPQEPELYSFSVRSR